MTRVILYIATSQDGFIADKDGGVDWLPQSDDHNEFGYEELLNRIQVIVMGSHSYKQILGFGDWAWSDKTTYVFTSQELTTSHDNIFFTHQDVSSFIKKIEPKQNIWLLGGAELIKSFDKENLIDEAIITIVPAVLGEGIKLDLSYESFTLVNTKTGSNGIVQKHYLITP